jgi:predicted O-methyltransferase YrrM
LSDPRADRVRAVRERIYDRDPPVVPVGIGPHEGTALRDAVVCADARRTLEAGLGWGLGTLFVLEGLLANGRDVQHVAADPWQRRGLEGHRTRFDGAGLAALDEAGVRELVEFYEEESQVVFPRLLSEGREFDLVFLDANHRFEGVFVDLFYAGRLRRDGGIAFVDDVQLPGVRRAVDFFVANLGWTVADGGAEGAEHEWALVRTASREAFLRPYFEFASF